MTEQDQVGIIMARMEALEVELATVTRALISLGSGLLAGGPPGPKGYMAWHEHQLNPPAPAEANIEVGQKESPSGSTGGSASKGQKVNPTSAAIPPGSSPTVLPPVSPGSSVPSSPSGSFVPLPNILPSTGASAGK